MNYDKRMATYLKRNLGIQSDINHSLMNYKYRQVEAASGNMFCFVEITLKGLSDLEDENKLLAEISWDLGS